MSRRRKVAVTCSGKFSAGRGVKTLLIKQCSSAARFNLHRERCSYSEARKAISAGDSPLTSREADVLELAADGVPVEEIARRAALSAGTVRNYLSAAVTKLGAANRHEAVRLARTHGWI